LRILSPASSTAVHISMTNKVNYYLTLKPISMWKKKSRNFVAITNSNVEADTLPLTPGNSKFWSSPNVCALHKTRRIF
jgi:hypothetical protein